MSKANFKVDLAHYCLMCFVLFLVKLMVIIVFIYFMIDFSVIIIANW